MTPQKVFSHLLLCLLLCPLLVLAMVIPWSRWIALLASWQTNVAPLLFWTLDKKHFLLSLWLGLVFIIIFMYPTSQDLNPLSKGDYCQVFVQELCIHARLLLLLEEPRVCKGLGIRISTHTNCSLLPRISKTSHAGPMSMSSSPRLAVTAMVVGTSTLNFAPVPSNIC